MNILSIEILTNNLDESEDFYNNRLGLKCIEKNSHSIKFSAGNSELILKKTALENPVYHFAFNIPCNKIDEARDWLNERIPVIHIAKDNDIVEFKDWNAKSVYFFDNNNNILEFIARFDLSNSTNEEFNIENLICISECGIATDDVDGMTNNIMAKTQLSVFSKQARSDNFTALGDDNGLIILSDIKRNWFPTKIRADRFFTKMIIETHNKTTELVFNEENI